MKISHLIASLAIVFLFATPAFAQTTDTETRLQALLAQIQMLQAKIMQLTGQSASNSSCITLSYNLYADQTDGTTNGEVSKLQRFLGGSVTGYFGPATLQLVQQWQASHGIVSSGSPDTTGYGYVGPKTRTAMAGGRGCEGSTGNIIASPTSGQAPLTVSFSTFLRDMKTYEIDYGDGSALENLTDSQAYPPYKKLRSHTYMNSGTYTAKLMATLPPLPCVGCVGRTDVVGTATITVNRGGDKTPLVTIVSPNGGESLKQGSPYRIRWTSTNLGSLNVELALINTEGYTAQYIVTDIPNNGSYKWVIGSSITPGSYRIMISSKDKGPSAQDFSDNFFTISESESQSLTIISPQPYYGLTRNQYFPIKWSTTSTDSSVPVSIELIGSSTYLVNTVSNTGTYNMFVSSDINGNTIPDGEYSMRLCTQVSKDSGSCDTVGPVFVSDKG